MARRSPVLWLVVMIVLAVPLAFAVYPVHRSVEGVGTITPNESGIVTRMHVSLHQDVELGRVPIDVADARLIVPGLPVTRDSVFVRLRLAEAPPRERLEAPLLITLTSPARPRLWLWLSGA